MDYFFLYNPPFADLIQFAHAVIVIYHLFYL
jgi:hypothetical protein